MSKAKTRFRARLSEAQNHRCCYCACIMDTNPLRPNGATIEHYQARSHGGPNRRHNAVAACKTCNEARGNMNPMKFWLLKNPQARGHATRIAAE